jgi:cysteinyl-tRNA synthetase
MDQVVYDLKHKFTEAMDDDLNIAKALAALFEFAREINKRMDSAGLAEEDMVKVLEALKTVNAVLGMMRLEPKGRDREVEALVMKREEARKRKDWGAADHIRDALRKIGVELTDTKEGTIWRRDRDSNTSNAKSSTH